MFCIIEVFSVFDGIIIMITYCNASDYYNIVKYPSKNVSTKTNYPFEHNKIVLYNIEPVGTFDDLYVVMIVVRLVNDTTNEMVLPNCRATIEMKTDIQTRNRNITKNRFPNSPNKTEITENGYSTPKRFNNSVSIPGTNTVNTCHSDYF